MVWVQPQIPLVDTDEVSRLTEKETKPLFELWG